MSNSTLRWSKPKLFNDPFDVQFDLHVIADRAAVRAATLDKIWDNYRGEHPTDSKNLLGRVLQVTRMVNPNLSRQDLESELAKALDESFKKLHESLPAFHEKIHQHMSNSEILCLSEIFDNVQMWAHYAEQQKGLVLRFRCVPELDSAWGAAEPVRYTNRMPRLFEQEALSDFLSGRASLSAEELVRKLVYTKADNWSYEREWRIFGGLSCTPNDYKDIRFQPCELDGVVFGCKMPLTDHEHFAEIIQSIYPHATVFAATTRSDDFSLIIREWAGSAP